MVMYIEGAWWLSKYERPVETDKGKNMTRFGLVWKIGIDYTVQRPNSQFLTGGIKQTTAWGCPEISLEEYFDCPQ